MGVSKCPDCGGKVSDALDACPHCGAPTANSDALAAADELDSVSFGPGPAQRIQTLLKNRGAQIGAVAVVVLVVVVLLINGGVEVPPLPSGLETPELRSLTQECINGEWKPCRDLESTLNRDHNIGLYPANEIKTLRSYLDVACDEGTQDACVVYAHMLENGYGGASSAARANVLREVGCDEGNGRSCSALASARSYDSELYFKACDLGDPFGCWMSGSALFEGDPDEKARARDYLEKACDGGFPAFDYLAMMLRYGAGGEKDIPRANELLKKGCDLGSESACQDLKKYTGGE